MTGLIAKKIGMTSFVEGNETFPATILECKDCILSGFRTKEENGYNAIRLSSFICNPNKLSKPVREEFKSMDGISYRSSTKEFRVEKFDEKHVLGASCLDWFKKGSFVDITSTSIGKSFAGSMKRHNFGGLEASHGVSISHRSVGSTGQCQDPGKVFKGKKMPGQMGNRRVTLSSKILFLDSKNGILGTLGSVPGSRNSIVYITFAKKKPQINLG